jgi:3-dehydroquinate dehydratase
MAKVCISIRDIDSIYCKFMAETRRDEVLEIRLDKCGFSEQEIKDVFSSQREAALLAAYPCRLATEREDAINALSTAILAGADLVDIETSLPEDSRRWLSSLAMNKFLQNHLLLSQPASHKPHRRPQDHREEGFCRRSRYC